MNAEQTLKLKAEMMDISIITSGDWSGYYIYWQSATLRLVHLDGLNYESHSYKYSAYLINNARRPHPSHSWPTEGEWELALSIFEKTHMLK